MLGFSAEMQECELLRSSLLIQTENDLLSSIKFKIITAKPFYFVFLLFKIHLFHSFRLLLAKLHLYYWIYSAHNPKAHSRLLWDNVNFLVAFEVISSLTLIYSLSFLLYSFLNIKLQRYLLTVQNVNEKTFSEYDTPLFLSVICMIPAVLVSSGCPNKTP